MELVGFRRHFVIIMCLEYFFGLFVCLLAMICVPLGRETHFKKKGEETKASAVIVHYSFGLYSIDLKP